jgi:polysaccharide export outer membrane protein
MAALLLVSVILVGCYNPQATPAGGYPPAYTGGPQATPSGLEPVKIPTPPGVPPVNAVSPMLRVQDMVIIDWFDMVQPIAQYKERIRDDGKLILPYNIIVQAAGRTTAQLQDDIRSAYVPKLYNHLTVTVKTEERFYFVGGEVRVPNRQYYYGDITVLRAIDTAGGFTDFANRSNIELRRHNGQTVKVNWKKVMKDPTKDPIVYPNDQIIVHKRIF